MAIHVDSEKKRLVLMDGTYLRIRPMLQLISPFLSTNKISRDMALAFYPTKLDVFFDTPGSCPNDHPRKHAKIKGCIYLNISECTFYLDYICLAFQMYMAPSASIRQQMDSDPRSPWDTPLNYTTGDLPLSLCAKILSIRAVRYLGGLGSGDPIIRDFILLYRDPGNSWNPYRFPNITSYKLLLIVAPGGEQHKFIRDISTMTTEDFSREWKQSHLTWDKD